jgi:hypothetical protein
MCFYFLIGQFEGADAGYASKTVILTACAQKSRKLDFQLKWREIGIQVIVILVLLAFQKTHHPVR